MEYIEVVVSKLPVVSVLRWLVKPMIYGVLLIFVYIYEKHEKKPIYLSYILVPAFFALAILVTGIAYPENWQYIQEVFRVDIWPCLPFFILGIMFKPEKKIMHGIGKASCLAILINVLYVLFFLLDDLGDDNMERAYFLLPNVMLAVWYAFDMKKLVPWLFSVLGMWYIVSMGTRGPVVILLVYLLLMYLLLGGRRSLKKTILSLVIGVSVIVFYQSQAFYNMLEDFAKWLEEMGLSSRVIETFLEGEFAESVSRDEIYKELWNRIQERMLLGYGVYGEWCWGFRTAHNIYLEILVHFGVPLGLTLLVSGLVLIVRTFIKSTNYYARSMILIWATFVLVQGIFGGSYLRYGVFFLLGFCLKEFHSTKVLPTEADQPDVKIGEKNG